MSKHRRGRGEGSIFKRSNGRWYANASLGSTISLGCEKRVRREVSGRTKTEVQQKLARLRDEAHGTADVTLTVSAWFERWLLSAKERVRPSTHALYGQIVHKHITPAIGYMLLAKLTPSALQHFYAKLAERGVSARTRKAVHSAMFSALKAAMRLGVAERNVAAVVDAPRYSAPSVRPLAVEQVRTLLEAARPSRRLHAMVLLAVTTGIRQGELFALGRADLDLEGATLAVRGTMNEDGTISAPKTARGRRRLDLSANVVTALRAYLADAPAGTHGELLFTSAEGAPLRKSNFIRRDWAPLLKRAGLPATKWHNLRHTSATLLLSQGVHPKVVQERLGHASIEMTMDTYSSVVPGMGRAAAQGLDTLLGGS